MAAETTARRRITSPASLLGWAAALLLFGCDGATEILLVIDTQLPDVQSFRVQAALPDGDIEVATANLRDRPAPRRLLFSHRGGELGPLRLEIGGTVGLDAIATAERVVTFESGRRIELHVELGPECQPGACAAGLTCGNDGGCRAPEVLPCEYMGRSCDDDGGTPDADLPDAGPDCGAICGVLNRHLIGDAVTLAPCVGNATEFTALLDGVPVTGPVRLAEIGPHRATLRGLVRACTSERAFEVVRPITLEAPEVSPTLVQDFAATVEAGFVTADRQLILIDGSGARTFLEDSTRDQGRFSVATYDDGLVVGGIMPASLTFVATLPPFEGADTRQGLVPPGLGTRVHAIAPHPDGMNAAALVTDGGALVARSQATVAFTELEAGAGGTWITWGAGLPVDHGSIWFGDTRVLRNRRLAGPPQFNGGAPVDAPSIAGELRRVLVDSNNGERLWFCGDLGVALIDLETQDWTATQLLPPTLALDEPCQDIAVSSDSEAWVVTPTLLVRIDRRGARVASYPIDGERHRVAFAEQRGLRALWLLGASNGAPLVFIADATE